MAMDKQKMMRYIHTTFLAFGCLLGGMYLGDKYMGKGEILAALCVMGDTAHTEGYLDQEQLLELARQTGGKLARDHGNLAQVLATTDRSVTGSLSDSNCSRVVNGLISGIASTRR